MNSVCFVCSRVFAREKKMWRHVTLKHMAMKAPAKFSCTTCTKVFNRKQHYNRHVASHTKARRVCMMCSMIYRSEMSLRIHLSRDHSVLITGECLTTKEHHCNQCTDAFGIKEELMRHKYYCKRRLKKERMLAEKRHKEEEKLRKLSIGSAGTSVISDDQTPQTSKAKSTRQKLDKSCPFCPLICATMQSLHRHILRIHPENADKPEAFKKNYEQVDSPKLQFMCTECGRRLSNATALNTHRKRVHLMKADHICDKCGKGYLLRSELKKHVKRTHGHDEPSPEPEDVMLDGQVKQEHDYH